MRHGSSLRTGRYVSLRAVALPPNGYPPMGIRDLAGCHSRSYEPQSIIVVFSQSGRNSGPSICTYVVSWNSSTAQVSITESTLGSDIALVCSSFEPCHCLVFIKWHSDSFHIAKPELPLRFVITVCRRFREPCHCVLVILRHTFAISISQGHFVLSNGITCVGGIEYAIHFRALNWFLDFQNNLLRGGS